MSNAGPTGRNVAIRVSLTITRTIPGIFVGGFHRLARAFGALPRKDRGDLGSMFAEILYPLGECTDVGKGHLCYRVLCLTVLSLIQVVNPSKKTNHYE